jgi:hypothetical protein
VIIILFYFILFYTTTDQVTNMLTNDQPSLGGNVNHYQGYGGNLTNYQPSIGYGGTPDFPPIEQDISQSDL